MRVRFSLSAPYGLVAQQDRATAYEAVSRGFESSQVRQNRGIVQLVERWSPKPNVVGSSPTAPANHVPLAQSARAPDF